MSLYQILLIKIISERQVKKMSENQEITNKTIKQSHLSHQQLVSAYMSQKAGMEKIDKQTIKSKVQEITKGSAKYLHEKQMQLKRLQEVESLKQRINSFTIVQKQEMKSEKMKIIQQLQSQRDITKYWAHLDFDMFYIACQLLDKPNLADKPCAVGGLSSVLCTANYQARKFGVRSALPTFIALKLCPQLVLFQPDFKKYKKYSDIFRNILSEYDQNLESHGLDQAYIQITELMVNRTEQQKSEIIAGIRERIRLATGLTVSCGVGCNKMLAKLASQEKKPNNQFIVKNQPAIIKQFLQDKNVRKIPGIGPVNQFYLKALGIDTPKKILQNLDIITICFSDNTAQFFIQASLGLGSNQHQFSERKSIGKSETFRCTDNYQFLNQKLHQLCVEVSKQMRELGYFSSNAIFSYVTSRFERKDKTVNLSKFTSNSKDLYQGVIKAFKQVKVEVRLLGVRVTALMKEQELKKMSIQHFLEKKQKKMVQVEKKNKNQNQIVEEIQKKVKYICPICDQQIDCKGNNSVLNRHIDKCMGIDTKKINNKSKN